MRQNKDPEPMKLQLENHTWWSYLEEDLQELLRESEILSEGIDKWGENFHDYAFVVFPAAKAYEGFLKKLFLDLGFITKEDYYRKHFRVGKALNPSLDPNFRVKEGVYHKLVEFCGTKKLADRLWDTWKKGRNLVFHWFPNEKNAVSKSEAQTRLLMIVEAMDEAFKECKMDRNG